MSLNQDIPYELRILESEKQKTTNQDNEYSIYDEIPFYYNRDYLYHGIRFQTHLEKLESIFKSKKILAGKFIDGYHLYSDNCNKGEYVSLLKLLRDTNIEYEEFIESTISLLITPAVNAIETKYISYNLWLRIQKESLKLKNIYSYMRGECLKKDFIPIEMVKAIGIPYQKLKDQGKEEYALTLIEDIQKLMTKHQIILPIVDTSRYNRLLVEGPGFTKKRKQPGRLSQV